MKFHERVAIFVAALIYAAVAVLIVSSLIDEGVRSAISVTIDEISAKYLFQSILIALAAVIVFVMLLRSLFASEPEERVIATDTEMGRINISMKAIENAVRRAAREVKGVRESSTRVDGDADGLSVSIDVAVSTDENIPEVSQQIQVALREQLRDLVGVPVKHVQVNVKDTSGVARPRLG
ncbi:MAG: alkaline shock response membrane anchor protein AmaP [Firmicutes bacterium]|nr:alkaline shock response membrane anchor protein AmaP [Bacillota bacterium]